MFHTLSVLISEAGTVPVVLGCRSSDGVVRRCFCLPQSIGSIRHDLIEAVGAVVLLVELVSDSSLCSSAAEGEDPAGCFLCRWCVELCLEKEGT